MKPAPALPKRYVSRELACRILGLTSSGFDLISDGLGTQRTMRGELRFSLDDLSLILAKRRQAPGTNNA